jgi:CheY-like chemotaxis protein
VTLDETLGPLEGAATRLQQVVWNLLTNAVKFTPPGGRVDIISKGGAESATVIVTDTGQGITADMLPHVFEAFRQADSSSTRTQRGLGLGLTLVRRLVELHGGTVKAESAGTGLGATFTVTLPLRASRGKPEARQGQDDLTRGREGDRTLDGVRVLVVDDDSDFRELAALVLRGAGAEVRTVSSAAGAREFVSHWLPTVLLVAMPGEDGFMLMSALRTMFPSQRLPMPIIAVTAYGTAESRARAALVGFDRYLTKPVDPADLAAAVAAALRRDT